MKKYCELLSPAGGPEHLKAAVENGADAVYLGGKLFNARINANNFTNEDIEEGVKYAHLRNVKVYVTMNTLLEDSDFQKALEYVDFLYRAGVDALIVQDLGLAKCVRDLFPGFPIHLSTQGSICNREGVVAAGSLGFERVVLARELSMAEIKECASIGNPEIEIFVHGAMCFCYSGQCHMSRLRGGRSGNKGMCAQPCRLPYSNGMDEGYFLSPKDLCLIDYLGEFVDSGVASLKIEGRMKSPEYVAVVTSIYRKYLDEYYKNGCYEVSEEDRHKLRSIFNRGGFTQGYMFENPEEKFLSGDTPKNRGVYIGKVVGLANNQLVDIKLEKNCNLNMGDGIEFRGKNGVSGNVVTYIKEERDILRIGDFKKKPTKEDDVYKVTDKILLNHARESYKGNNRKSKINMYFCGYEGIIPTLEIELARDKSICVVVEGDSLIEAAKTRAVDEEIIRKQLSKTGESPFCVENIQISIGDNISIPIAYLNSLRRLGIEELEKLIIKKTNAFNKNETVYSNENEYSRIRDYLKCNESFVSELKNNHNKMKTAAEKKGRIRFFFSNIESAKKYNVPDELLSYERIYIIPIKEYMENDIYQISDNETIPMISSICRGAEDGYIRNNFENIIGKVKKSGIYIGNLAWIKPFADEGIKVYGGFGLNASNKQTKALFEKLGVVETDNSLEMDNGEKTSGKIPAMITEHPLLKDRSFSNNKRLNGKELPFRAVLSKDKYIIKEIGDKTIITIDSGIDLGIVKSQLKEGKDVLIFC